MSGDHTLTVEVMESRLANKIHADEAFKAELVHSPRSTIEAEFSIKILPIFDIAVNFDDADSPQIVLTRRTGNSELSEEELESVAGGGTWPVGPDMDWVHNTLKLDN